MHFGLSECNWLNIYMIKERLKKTSFICGFLECLRMLGIWGNPVLQWKNIGRCLSICGIEILNNIYYIVNSRCLKVKGHPKLQISQSKFSYLRKPGHVAQSVGHLTRKSGVLGLIPGLATYFRFSFRFFKKGSCQLLAKVCARSTG